MVRRTNGGVFNDQMITGSLRHFVLEGADFSGAVNSFGKPVPGSAAEIIFTNISEDGFINIMNPNSHNISFALEINRSHWTGPELTDMVQSLGTDVGTDHINCSVCTVTEVPYIWNLGAGASSFLALTDVPHTYAGSAGFVVSVNPGETGLIFTPATASNAFSFVASPGQSTISSFGSDTLTFVAGSNVNLTTDPITKSVTINSTAGTDYIPVPPGTSLSISTKYFVTAAGTVTLPKITGSMTPGKSVTVTKTNGAIIFVNVGQPSDIINTDLGTTNSIEFDATQECIFVISNSNTWNLQIGSAV